MIKGSSTIEELAETVILMFHGDLAHLYDAINEQTQEFYTQSEDFVPGGMTKVKLDLATVSLLNEKDKLTIHYDYGDDWEFKLYVQKFNQLLMRSYRMFKKPKVMALLKILVVSVL